MEMNKYLYYIRRKYHKKKLYKNISWELLYKHECQCNPIISDNAVTFRLEQTLEEKVWRIIFFYQIEHNKKNNPQISSLSFYSVFYSRTHTLVFIAKILESKEVTMFVKTVLVVWNLNLNQWIGTVALHSENGRKPA